MVLESISLDIRADAATDLLAVIADPTRWSVVRQLARSGPTCVCKIDASQEVAPNLMSYHLKVLRDAGLVEATRRGRWIDYSLAADALERLHGAIPSTGELP